MNCRPSQLTRLERVTCCALAVANIHGRWGPCKDTIGFRKTMEPATQPVKIRDLYADAGYDAEWIPSGILQQE